MTYAEHGSRIIGALERAWAAIQDRNPEVPDVVIVTGAGIIQHKGPLHGVRRHGHHWPGRWVITGTASAPELFIAGELLADGGQAVLQEMLHESAHALAVVRGIRDTSAESGRYHNRRFVALATEVGLREPDRPATVTGWSACTLTPETAFAYRDLVSAIDAAGLPYLPDLPGEEPAGADSGGEDQDEPGRQDAGAGKPARRGGRRLAVECACTPPRRLQLTPKAMDDGPVLCGVCGEPFEPPEDDGGEELTGRSPA
jgi:hypothetical protein